MKRLSIIPCLLFVLFVAASSFLAGAWIGPWRNRSLDFTFGTTACHVASRNGALQVSSFSTVAEDGRFHAFELPCWTLELTLLACAALLGWHLARFSRPGAGPGFPLDDLPAGQPSPLRPRQTPPRPVLPRPVPPDKIT